MKVFNLQSAQAVSDPQLRHWLYNSLDCVGTRQIADHLDESLDETDQRTYAFERSVQAPAFAMMMRGVDVDPYAHEKAIKQAEKDLAAAEQAVRDMPLVQQVWDGTELVTGHCPASKRKDGRHTWEKGVEDTKERTCTSCGTSRFTRAAINPNSDQQVQHLLYDLLKLPKQRNKDKKVTADKEAMDKLREIVRKRVKMEPIVGPLIEALQDCSKFQKQLGFLNFKKTPNGRLMSSFSIGTAWTGRWSSSKDHFGFGGNMQNITETFRNIVVPDPGMELCYADLKQAESNVVAHLAGDEKYIEAHKGDTHTYVCRLVWPELEWTGDLKQDKQIATTTYFDWDNRPGHDARFQSKAVQHGTNLGLTAFGMAVQKRISVKAASDGQRRYREAFPGVPGWQGWIRGKVQAQEFIYSPTGVKVRLFGRPLDEHTYKQGLAFAPQRTVADLINFGVWRIWTELEPKGVELLAQIHDAILFQFPKGRYDLVKEAAELMRVPLDVTDYRGTVRTVTIDVEAAVGMNWGHQSETNPHGLKEIHV